MPNVWIINKGEHSYESAEAYGDLKEITNGRVNIFQTDNLKAKIATALAEATKEDFLLLSGSIIPNALAIHHMIQANGFVKCLVWMGNQNQYKTVTLK